MFEVYTYAAETAYVPKWLGNRDARQDGKDFFTVGVLPLNDAEFNAFRLAIDGLRESGPLAMVQKLLVELEAAGSDLKKVAEVLQRLKAAIGSGSIDDQLDHNMSERVIRRRVPWVRDLRVPCNDGSTLIPKTGAEIYDLLRPRLDVVRFAALRAELVSACTDHSVLSLGELKGSDSSSDLPEPRKILPSDDGSADGVGPATVLRTTVN